jgi:hypothetical protein
MVHLVACVSSYPGKNSISKNISNHFQCAEAKIEVDQHQIKCRFNLSTSGFDTRSKPSELQNS